MKGDTETQRPTTGGADPAEILRQRCPNAKGRLHLFRPRHGEITCEYCAAPFPTSAVETLRHEHAMRTARFVLDDDGALRCEHCHASLADLLAAQPEPYTENPSPYASRLLPPTALLEVSRCLAAGVQSHGEDNWRQGPPRQHVGRAITHLLLYLAGSDDGPVEELRHAACRVLFALDLEAGAAGDAGNRK